MLKARVKDLNTEIKQLKKDLDEKSKAHNQTIRTVIHYQQNLQMIEREIPKLEALTHSISGTEIFPLREIIKNIKAEMIQAPNPALKSFDYQKDESL